jgi:hypothetical protein
MAQNIELGWPDSLPTVNYMQMVLCATVAAAL